MQLKKLVCLFPLGFIVFCFNVLASTHSVKDWINSFNTDGIKIFYSSDFISELELNFDLSLDQNTIQAFNQGLHALDLKVENVADNIYVIQSYKASKPIIGGMIIEAHDGQTGEKISNFQFMSQDVVLDSQASIIFIYSQDSQQYKAKIQATGYDSKSLDVRINPSKFLTKSISLTPKPVNLNKVIVTTSQFNLNRQSSLTSLDRSDIENNVSISNDPLTSVNTVAGNSTNGISGKSRTRGGNENEALIVFDNNTLRNPYHFKDFFSLASTINTSVVEGIDFYSGVFPAEYGGRLSSVIAINTDDNIGKYSHEVGMDALNFYTTYRHSNEDYSRQYLASIRTGGHLIKSKLIEDSIVKPEFDDAYFKSTQQLNNFWKSSQHLLLSRDELNFNVADNERSQADYQDQNLWLQWHYTSSKDNQANILFYANHSQNNRDGMLSNDQSQSSLNEKINTSYFGLKYNQNFYFQENWTVDFGLNIFKETTHIQSQRNINQDGDFLQQLELVQHSNRNFKFNNAGYGSKLFINNRYKINSKFIFDLGIRYEYKQWIDENINSPRFNLTYFYNPSTTFRLGLGRHQQSQYIDELLLEDEEPEYFKPASADVAVLEFNKVFSNKMLLRAEIYQKKYSHTLPYYENTFNNLHVLPELYFDRSRITPEDSSASGFELTLSDQSHTIKWSASYIFSDVHDIIDLESETADSSSHQTQSRSWDQHHAVKFNMHIPIKSWFLDVVGNYHSGWPKTTIFETPDGLQIGQRNKNTFDKHIQFDFKLSKNFNTEKGILKMSLQANNIFNNANICCVDYALNEGKLTQNKKQWLPIVPNFSLTYYWH